MLLKHNRKNRANRKKAFTLVELAIVLVVIGLIIGGVLVGQDLINAAQVRSAITQVERYNTAVNTFRLKYNALPGDIRNPDDFGLGDTPSGVALGDGDGNGLLASDAGGILNSDGEITMFWNHLSAVNLIEGGYDGAQTEAALDVTLPRSKLGRSGVGVYFSGSDNYFQFGVENSTSGSNVAVYASAVTPEEAYSIDQKMDDSAPLRGLVQARGGTTPDTALSGTAADGSVTSCITSTVANTAIYTSAAGVGVTCQLRFRMN